MLLVLVVLTDIQVSIGIHFTPHPFLLVLIVLPLVYLPVLVHCDP